MLKKLMLLAAMLAMVLVAAAPAFAQDVIAGDQYDQYIDDSFNTLTVAECIQLVDQDIDQYQVISGDVEGGEAEAYANDESNAAAGGGDASVDQTASQEAVQYCNDVVLAEVVEAEASESASASASSSSSSSSSSSGGSSSSSSTLPATGGISLLTLGAGALLVGGGLVARKLVR